MRTEVKLITPELAKKYLEKNSHNRRINEKTVNYYAHQMENNLWKLTGQSISLSSENILLDGQHRLRAIIKSGKSIKMLVVFDADPDSFDVYDKGKKRSHDDSLYILGIPNSTNIASSINRYNAIVKNKSLWRVVDMPITTNEVIQIYYSDEEKWQYCVRFAMSLYTKLRLYQVPTIVSLKYYLENNLSYSQSHVELFFNKLFGVETEVSNEVTGLLRDKLLQNALIAKKFTYDYKILLLNKTWNIWNTKKTMKLLKIQPDEDFEELI